jgi:Vacuolar protein sorting-associated protein 26
LPKKTFSFFGIQLISIFVFCFFSLSGQIELFYDRGNHHEFLTQLKELARHGDLIKNTSYPFEFPNVEKLYEVYTGSNVRLRCELY